MKNVPHVKINKTSRFEIRNIETFELITTAELAKTARTVAEKESGYIMVIDNDAKYRTAMIIKNGVVETISKDFAIETK